MNALRFDNSPVFDPKTPDPSPLEGDALIKVVQAGICNTDLEIVKGYMGYKGILGHEFVGVVKESPNPALVNKRVVSEINIACGRCDLCLAGLSNHCRNRSVLGISKHNGAFADYVRMPSGNLHLIPDDIDNDNAVFVEPLAAAFQILKQVKIDSRKWVTVLGDGKLGLLVAQVLQTTGAPVRVIGRHSEKLALCEKWSIRSRLVTDIIPRHDQDIVVDCTGTSEGFELAAQMTRPRGTLVLKSTAAQNTPLNLAPLVVDEITVIGSRCGPFKEALTALGKRQIDVLSLIHRRMKLEQGIAAMKLAGTQGVAKVILTM
jgi:alcohol dehydrogenase